MRRVLLQSARGRKETYDCKGKDEAEVYRKIESYLEKKNRDYVEKLEELQKAEEEQNKPPEFAQVGEMWYGYYVKSKELSFSIRDIRRDTLKKLNREIGTMPIDAIDNETARRLINKCSIKEDGSYYSKSYVDKLQQTFRMVMEYAVKNGYCQLVPDKVPLSENLTVPDADERYLGDDQVRAVLRAVCNNPKYSTFLQLLWATGMRQEEAFALRMDDFKIIKDGMVEVSIYKTVVEVERYVYAVRERTKTKASKRKICIPDKIYEIVKAYYEDCIRNETPLQKQARKDNDYEGYIFLNSKMKPYNKRTFERNFSDYLKRNGIDFRVTLHMFRHVFVSNMAEDVSLDKVSKMIGDSLATTNAIYQSLSNRTHAEICKKVLEKHNELEK